MKDRAEVCRIIGVEQLDDRKAKCLRTCSRTNKQGNLKALMLSRVLTMIYDSILEENILLSELEERIVDLEKFRRLKFIKQNGFAYLSYPNATNNRLDHSVGTMFWATKLYESIFLKKGKAHLENDKLQAIRLSALVHDIGHGPFSHAVELLFERNPILWSLKPWSGLRKKFGNRRPHELLALRFLNSATFKKLVSKEIGLEVRRILQNQSPLSLLISGDLDADRLDYLLRDSRHSGLPFGLNVKPIFNQLIRQNLRIIKSASGYFLLIDSKGMPAFEQLLIARYAHYNYIAYEPKILSANLVFLSELEKSLWQQIRGEGEIALAVFYILTELTDDKMLDLDFSDLEKRKGRALETQHIKG